jgi:hypothetical protein
VNPIKSVAFKDKLAASKQNEQVEHGNATTVEKAMTEEERVIASILKPADPAANLFADFGA